MATNHINLSISGARQEKYAALSKLADSLGCRITDLCWAGVDNILKNPPKADDLVKAGSAPKTGSARGFWVIHTRDDSGRLTGVSVKEVEARSQAAGATFVRYKAGDVKGRVRAMNQAVKSAQYDAALAGVKVDKLAVSELSDKEGKAAPKPAPKAEAATDTAGKPVASKK